MKLVKIILLSLLALVASTALIWYSFFKLSDYHVSAQTMAQTYLVEDRVPEVSLTQLNDHAYELSYKSFDGAMVNGRLVLPQDNVHPMPVMVGIHGMGRAHVRWWQDSYKGRATLEQTDKLTEMALAKGYAVIAIDARNHGQRKDPNLSIRDIMLDLYVWGKRDGYEQMIVNTVKDHRLLIKWLQQNPRFTNKISLTGYSMGGQISLLLTGLEPAVTQTMAIVPPHIGQGTAIVSPLNLADDIAQKVWLVSASEDEYASIEQNNRLFDALTSTNKKHIQIEGEHILPAGYYQQLKGWF